MLASTVAVAPVSSPDSDTRTLQDLAALAILDGLMPQRFDPARVSESLGYFPSPRSIGQARFDHLRGPRRSVAGQAPIQYPGMRGIGLADGRTFTLTVGPGVVSVASTDLVRAERTRARLQARSRQDADLLARRLLDEGQLPADPAPSRRITHWSARSRSRMVKAFGEVDWSVLLDPAKPLGMVTLTYPGDWLAVVPTGPELKRHLRLLQLRYRRALGDSIRGAWKLEFQDRGAPHVHIICPVPAMVKGRTFEAWLAETWAKIVAADWCGDRCWIDPETGRAGRGLACCEFGKHLVAGTGVDFAETAKMTDPKRLGVYFLKHSAKTGDGKEYQHIVPEAWQADGDGPGRFWGFWGMSKVLDAIELDTDDYVTARRLLRGAMRGRARRVVHDRTYHAARRDGYDHLEASAMARDASTRVPKRWTLGSSGALTGGFFVVNDGPDLAMRIGYGIRLRRDWLDDQGL